MRLLLRVSVALILLALAALVGLRATVWPDVQERYGTDERVQAALAEVLAPSGFVPTVSGVELLWPALGWPEVRINRLELVGPDAPGVAEATGLRLRLGPLSLWALAHGEPGFHSLRLAEFRLSVDKPTAETLVVGGKAVPSTASSEQPTLPSLTALGPVDIGRIELIHQGQSLVAYGLGVEAGSQRPRVRVGDADLGEVFALANYVGAIPQSNDGPTVAWAGQLADLDLETRLPTPAQYAEPSAWLAALLGAEGSLQLRDFQLLTTGPISALVGASASLKIDDGDVRLVLQGQDVSLVSEPWVHAGSLDLSSVQGTLLLQAERREVSGLRVVVESLSVDDPKLRLRAQGRAWIPVFDPEADNPDLPTVHPSLELKGNLDGVQPKSVASILPTVIGLQAREWLSMALQDGRPMSGSFALAGDPNRFPFPNGDGGMFSARLRVENQTLQFADPARWPAAQGVFADVTFNNGSLSFESRQGQLLGNPVRLAKGQIPELGADVPILDLTLDVGNSLPDLLQLVKQSPIREFIDGLTDEAVAQGRADVVVGLGLNLNDLEESTVEGRLRIRDAKAQLLPILPAVGQLRGELEFTHQGLDRLAFDGVALGGPVSIRQLADDSALVLEGSGKFKGPELERWLGSLLGLRLRDIAAGESAWQMRLETAGGGLQLRLLSELQGLALRMPAPVAKPAADRWGLELLLDRPGLPATAALPARGGPRQTWQIKTRGGQLAGRFTQEREVDGRAAREPRLQGLISVGQPLPVSAVAPFAPRGLVISAQAAGTVSVDPWIDTLSQKIGADPNAEPSSLPPALSAIVLRAPGASLGRQQFRQVAFSAAPPQPQGPEAWRMQLQSIEAAGELLWGPSETNASVGLLQGQLGRLWLQRSDGINEREPTEVSLARPSDWPEMRLSVADLRLGAQPLGRLVLRGSPDLAANTWNIASADLQMPGGSLNAVGAWAPSATTPGRAAVLPSTTQLKASLRVDDGDALLTHLVGPNLVRGAAGSLQAELRWAGSPADFSIVASQGTLSVDLGKGQFLKAEPGAAKLLGVLNLQSLSRRITFDFRDLFAAGFAFETVRGTASLGQGTLSTDNLRIVGVQAAVLIDGTADLLRETQSLEVLVLPEVNAGLASLGYALINPAIGLASFLAQYIVSNPLSKALSFRLKVTGPWADPKVQEIPNPPAKAEGSK